MKRHAVFILVSLVLLVGGTAYAGHTPLHQAAAPLVELFREAWSYLIGATTAVAGLSVAGQYIRREIYKAAGEHDKMSGAHQSMLSTLKGGALVLSIEGLIKLIAEYVPK